MAVLLLAFGVTSSTAHANSAGSPICEVHSLPLVEMSKTLATPPPDGWYLETARPVYFSGEPLRIRLRHADPDLQVRGMLLWAKSSPSAGAGHFELPGNGRWQYMPGSSNCGEWAISHTDGIAKSQSLLQFDWNGGQSPTAVLRAFLIEECGEPEGLCRDQQGLTELLVLERGIFRGTFES